MSGILLINCRMYVVSSMSGGNYILQQWTYYTYIYNSEAQNKKKYIIRLLQRPTFKFKMGFISSHLHIFTRSVSNVINNIVSVRSNLIIWDFFLLWKWKMTHYFTTYKWDSGHTWHFPRQNYLEISIASLVPPRSHQQIVLNIGKKMLTS